MSTEQNKAIVRKAIDALSRGDMAGTEYLDTEIVRDALCD